MKIRTSAVVRCVVGFLALCVTADAQTAQKKTQNIPKPAAASEPSAEHMQHEMEDATPGAAHGSLAKLAGQYTTVTKFYMQPGASPQESTGEANLSMTLDGRFLTEADSGTFMGQPLKGFRMVGYNNASMRYEGIWTYTMSTGIMTLNGTSPDGGKTIRFAGSFDRQNGAKEKLDILMRALNDDRFVVELSGQTPDGKPGPRLVTTYTRKK